MRFLEIMYRRLIDKCKGRRWLIYLAISLLFNLGGSVNRPAASFFNLNKIRMKVKKFLEKLTGYYTKNKFPVRWFMQEATFSFEVHHHEGLYFIGDKPIFESSIYYWDVDKDQIIQDIKEARSYYKKCDFMRLVGKSMNNKIPERAIVVLKGFGEGAEVIVEHQGNEYKDDVAMYQSFPYVPHKETSSEFFERMRKKYLKPKTEQDVPSEAPIVHIQKKIYELVF